MQKIMKKLLLSLLLSVVVINISAMEDTPKNQKLGVINNVKNKTAYAFNSIVDTVKSDLGFADEKKNKEPYSLVKDIAAGCRLYCYTYATRMTLNYLLNKINFLDDMPPQFEKHEKPNALLAIAVAPVIEELVFTDGLANVMLANSPLQLPVAAQTLVPLLFGALHYHDNPKRWALNIMYLSPMSFYNIRYVLTREKPTRSAEFRFAPIISHMVNNMHACYMISK